MKKFDFRLERLLRVREHLEKMQQVETMQQEGKVAHLAQGEELLKGERSHTIGSLSPARGARWRGNDQATRVAYLGRVEHQLVDTQTTRKKEEEVLEKDRRRLIERSRDRKTVEALKVRAFDRWREEAQREENLELDEIGQRLRQRRAERGSTTVTVLLLLFTVALGWLCFSTWNNWVRSGDVGYPILRAPFDQLAQDRVQKELQTFENDQRLRRQKLERLVLESRSSETEVVVEAREREGFRRTLERIRQKEDELRRKEEELKSRQAALEQSQRELTAEIRRNNNLLNRISTTLADLQSVEEKRTREITEDRKRRVNDLAQMVRRQKPADAATLLLAVAFPDPLNPLAPPFPPDQSFEGPDLVLEVLAIVPSTERADIMNKMVRESPEKSALLFDMMDNPKTGLEPEPETARP